MPSLDASRTHGLYATPAGSLLALGQDDSGWLLMDYATRQQHRVEVGDDGSLALAGNPEARLEVVGDVLRLSLPGGEPVQAVRRPQSIEAFSFANDGLALAGQIWLPDGEPTYPAVVLVPGAGPGTRYAFGHLPYFLLSLGFAVVTFDKRGCGESQGDFQPWAAGVQEQAGDVMAAMDPLLMRPDIHAGQIGLLGHSLGAWVVVKVAARVPETAFAGLLAGGGVRLVEAELHRVRQAVWAGLAAAGTPASEIPAALDAAEHFSRQVFRLLAAGPAENQAARDELGVLLSAAASEPWYAFTRGGEYAEAPVEWIAALGQAAWERTLSYDPGPELAQVYCPVLGLIGEDDALVPGQATLKAWQSRLAHNPETTLRVLPRADHNFFALPLTPAPTVAEGFLETLGPWLHQAIT
jgi:pimeloyl-ACP methyl ester carboxylesterase